MRNLDLLEKCTEDILYVIRPTEDDKKKRLGAVEEIVNSIYVVGASRAWVGKMFSSRQFLVTSRKLSPSMAYTLWALDAVKPFGSFVSNLYAKSGDLDVSVELTNDSGFPTSKDKKKEALRELGRALQFKGVARDLQLILSARVPVLKYVSNHFGISCDISIDNYPGRIKSRCLHWVSTIDDRFGDMVLLVKEWARAQNINDPKNGTLNSYTLCLLVIGHFQHCKPAILPPMKEIFYASIAEGSGGFNEKHFDRIWKENIAKFRRRDIGQKNQSSLSNLLATFFSGKSATYTGQLKQNQDMAKSSCSIVNDIFDRSDANITVGVPGLQRIASAFRRATDIINFYEPAVRNELVSLLCTPEVGLKLGGGATAECCVDPEISPQQHVRIHQLLR